MHVGVRYLGELCIYPLGEGFLLHAIVLICGEERGVCQEGRQVCQVRLVALMRSFTPPAGHWILPLPRHRTWKHVNM